MNTVNQAHTPDFESGRATKSKSMPVKVHSTENIFDTSTLRRDTRSDEILKRYDEGPTKEELDASQYKTSNVNRYGFIIGPLARHFDERISDETLSIGRWTRALENWNKFTLKNKKAIHSYVLAGIPDSLRGQIWKKFLHVDEQIERNQGIYEDLKKIARKRSQDIEQIDKDVERTHRTHIAYHVRYSEKQKQLLELLVTYSMYDSKIRYCQGMNEIAGTLLMYMSEEEAFWALRSLMFDEIHNIHGFYIDNFPKLKIFEEHFQNTMDMLVPVLSEHFKQIGFSVKIVTTKWFLLCFMNSLPFTIVLRIWDRFMLEGSSILYPTAFAIIKYHEKQLLKSSLDQVAQMLKETDQFRYDSSEFFNKLEKYIQKLRNLKLYPIPGVQHDIIDVDLSLLLSEETDSVEAKNSGSGTDPTELWTLSGESKISASRGTMKKNSMTYMRNLDDSISKMSLFDPSSNQAPSPSISWTQFMETNKELFLSHLENVNPDDADIDMICDMIRKANSIKS